MAFMPRRLLSTTTSRLFMKKYYMPMQHSLAIPSPTYQGAVLNSPELQQLANKAKGPWKEVTDAEAVTLYRATFDMTFKEIRKGQQHWKLVVPGTAFFMVLGYFLANFLRENFGPELPHTMNNPEWDAAMLEENLKNRANPITGLGSKYAKHNQQSS